MKIIFFLNIFCALISFYSSPLFAQKEEIVDSLEKGSCWVKLEEKKNFFQAKIASFGNGKAIIWNQTQLPPLVKAIQEKLRPWNIEELAPLSYELFIHCSSTGMRLLANLYDTHSEIKLCVHFQTSSLPEESFPPEEIAIEGIYTNYEGEPGACMGQNPSGLFLHINTSSKKGLSCLQTLREDYSHLFQLQKFTKDSYFLNIAKKYWYRQKQVKQTILDIPQCQEVLLAENIEYDQILLEAGTIYKIFEGSLNDYP